MNLRMHAFSSGQPIRRLALPIMRWLAVFLVLAGCVPALPSVVFHAVKGDVSVSVEIADSPEEWGRGLMFRESLDGGMLFVFPDEKERVFWMKNTKIPLDIIFISSDMRVVSIVTAVPCTEDPCSTYPSKVPAKYVVEVNAGFADKNGITEGTIIDGPAGIPRA